MSDELLQVLGPGSFAIAYRMLDSLAAAEDVVQESLLRFHRAIEGDEQIQSPRAFVATVTTCLAIDELREARKRRERYTGEWLPEPILTDGEDDAASHAGSRTSDRCRTVCCPMPGRAVLAVGG